MKVKKISKAKRTISAILAISMLSSIANFMPAVADTPIEPVSRTYSGDGYEVRYDITSGWADNRNVQVTLTNTGDEPIQNWALKYDVQGEIVNIWNGTVAASGDDWSIIKNAGYNYEIWPNSSTSFGYIVQGSDIDIPTSIELCSKRVESDAADYSVSLNVESEWDTGFTGNIKIENTGNAPLEAWRLSFDTNFDLEDVWNASVISSESNHYTVSNSYATASIAVGETVTFGIRGTKKAGKSLVLSDISMTEMSISADFTDTNKPDDSSSETDSSSEADSSSETDSSSEVDSSSETESSSVIDSTPDESSSSETDSKPDEDTGDISVVAYGAYNADESAIDIEWYTETAGTYEVVESSDNENYTSVIEVSDFTTYRYHITEDFDTKYFKVKVTSGKKSAESIALVATKTEDGYIIDYIDFDSDGINDMYEGILGTDNTKPDTDDDGLTDYQEIYLTGTDPLVYDSVTSGISDAEADSDNDGLSNIKELEVGTETSSDDTDGDKLRDGDEVNKYGTDPLIVDTDEDGLSDYEEVSLNLDPLNGSSDGKTSDKDKKFVQTVGEDADAFAAVNTEDNPFKVSMKISASGLACENLDSGKSGYANVIQNDAVLGIVPEFTYTEGLSVDDVEIYFNIDKKYTSNTNGKYSAVSDEFEGIKRLNVFKYFDDIDMLLPIETTYDEQNYTVSTHVNELGTYCLLDMETWFETIGVSPSEFETTVFSGSSIGMVGIPIRNSLLNLSASTIDTSKSVSQNIDVFFFTNAYNEYTRGLDADNIEKCALKLFKKYGETGRVHVYIVQYTGSCILNSVSHMDYAVNKAELNSALTTLRNLTYSVRNKQLHEVTNAFFNNIQSGDITYRENSEKYAVMIESKVFETDYLDAIANRMKEKSIRVSVISSLPDHKSLAYDTNGKYIKNLAVYGEEIANFIIGNHKAVYTIISPTNYKVITLDAPITSDYKTEAAKIKEDPSYREKIKNKYADQDKDGLLDLEEIRYGIESVGTNPALEAVTWKENGEINLPTLKDCLEFAGGQEYLAKVIFKYKDVSELMEMPTFSEYINELSLRVLEEDSSVRILPLLSNPIMKDTDYDGVSDFIDYDVANVRMSGELEMDYRTGAQKNHGKKYDEIVKSKINYSFSLMDFFENNKKYNKDLAKTSVLASAIVYEYDYLHINGYTYNINQWLKHHGFKDVHSYKINEGSELFNIKEYKDNHISELCIGHQLVSFNNEDKEIIAIIIRGTNGTTTEWSSNFDIGSTKERFAYRIWDNSGKTDTSYFDYSLTYLLNNNYNELLAFSDWKKEENHKGFDIAANRLYNYIKEYTNKYINNSNISFWITGHSRAAGIANVLSANLIDDGNEFNTFAYTFASPNTTADLRYDDSKYSSIFNIINQDDFVPQLPIDKWGFRRYGVNKYDGIKGIHEKEWELLTNIKTKIGTKIPTPIVDYNCDYFGLQKTVNYLAEVALDSTGRYNRNNCYTFTCSCHGDSSLEDYTYYTYSNISTNDFYNIMDTIPINAMPYYQYTINNVGKRRIDVRICQTPMYFMQILSSYMADQTSAKDLFLTLNVGIQYEYAKGRILSSGIGGLSHPHYLESYYIITNHIW